MWQKYDTSPLYDLETVIYVSVFFSFQDSINEACAQRIGDEHYRLQGRAHHRRLHFTDFGPLYFELNENLKKRCLQKPSRYLCGSFLQLFILSPLLHTQSLSPNNVLMRSPLPSPPASPPPPSFIRPSPRGALQKCLLSSMFFPPMWCDPGLRAPGGESLSLPFKDRIGREAEAELYETSLEFWKCCKKKKIIFISAQSRETRDNATDKWSMKWFVVIGLNLSLCRGCPPYKTDVANENMLLCSFSVIKRRRPK